MKSVDQLVSEGGSRCVLCACNGTPPMGPPGAGIHRGNSAPAHALVGALQQSERSGERRGCK